MALDERAMSEQISITVTRQDKYKFLVDFGPATVKTTADEPNPRLSVAALVLRQPNCWPPPLRTAFPQAFFSPSANSRKIPDV